MVTLTALSIGIVLFGHQDSLLSSVQWFSVGIISSMVLYFGKTYAAFFGGLILAIYTASLWPLLLRRVTAFQPHKLFAVAMPVYFGYILLSVWVVAYNFVPGGVVTRERTDVLLLVIIFCCGLGTCDLFWDRSPTATISGNGKATKEVRTVTLFGRAFRRLSVIEEEQSENSVIIDRIYKLFLSLYFWQHQCCNFWGIWEHNICQLHSSTSFWECYIFSDNWDAEN